MWKKKKRVNLVFGKVSENYPKIKKSFQFMKPTSKRAISTGNHLFGPLLDNNEIQNKKKGEFGIGQSVRKLPDN